jgi:hypothetical protein
MLLLKKLTIRSMQEASSQIKVSSIQVFAGTPANSQGGSMLKFGFFLQFCGTRVFRG